MLERKVRRHVETQSTLAHWQAYLCAAKACCGVCTLTLKSRWGAGVLK